MSARMVVIVNPFATAASSKERIAQTLEKADIVELSRGTDITALARQYVRDGYRIVAAAGGDGTVSAVAAAILNTDAALGVLPLGGLNHFARDLGLPPDLAGAAHVLEAAKTRFVDVAEVNGHFFLNNSGLGLYPSLVAQREKRRRLGQRKWVAFSRASIATFRRFPFLDVRLVTGGKALERRTPFVFVGNNHYRMEGIRLGSRDSLTRGELCLGVAPYSIGRWGLIRLAFRALFGRLRSEHDFRVFCAREVTIASRHHRLPVSLDGEVRVLETPLSYRIRPEALRVVAP